MMRKLNQFIGKVGADRLLHFSFGGWAVSAASPYGAAGIMFAFLFVAALSALKEFHLDDNPDWKDIAASVSGAFAGILLYVPYDIWAS